MFDCSISIDKLKKQANAEIVNNSGVACSGKKFINKSAKRAKTSEAHFEENALYESKVYLEIKQKFNLTMQKSFKCEIDQAKKTRRYTYKEVDSLALGAINQAAGDYATLNPLVSMSDIARLLQAAQHCFQEAIGKQCKIST